MAPHLRREEQAHGRAYAGGAAISTGTVYDEKGEEEPPFRDDDRPAEPSVRR
jgi:hypothetical protein